MTVGASQHGKVNPGVGDPVTFRVAVNHLAVKAAQAVGGRVAMHAGRRATQVTQAACPPSHHFTTVYGSPHLSTVYDYILLPDLPHLPERATDSSPSLESTKQKTNRKHTFAKKRPGFWPILPSWWR